MLNIFYFKEGFTPLEIENYKPYICTKNQKGQLVIHWTCKIYSNGVNLELAEGGEPPIPPAHQLVAP